MNNNNVSLSFVFCFFVFVSQYHTDKGEYKKEEQNKKEGLQDQQKCVHLNLKNNTRGS